MISESPAKKAEHCFSCAVEGVSNGERTLRTVPYKLDVEAALMREGKEEKRRTSAPSDEGDECGEVV